MRNNFSAFIIAFALVILSGAFGTAWSTTTSTITIGGTDYTLFTGFTATNGTAVDNTFVYGNMVDGDTSTSFHAFTSPAYVEFNSGEPIIPKGYIFNTFNADNFKPTGWELKAKTNTSDGWTTLSSYSGQTLSSGQEFQYACGNDGNTQYKYFRFEASNSNNNIWLTEIRLYGFENLTYTHLTVRAATCTETGIKQECYLRSDGKYFSDENGTNELNASDVIIPKTAHTGVHHEADATHIEYWQCSVCSKYFSDSDCTHEISENQTLVLKYLDNNGTLTTLSENTTAVTSSLNAWSNGWYVVYENITISGRITVSGTVNLILCNNATLTASKGITVGSDATFNVYAQSTDEAAMGALVASTEANSNNAAIGGVQGTNFGSIVINGGKITATTNNACGGAPIGGGYGSTAGSITINGGIVSATAHDYTNSAGIGGGNNGYLASIILNGGIITATGDAQSGGAGIGTGSYASSGIMTVTISSGVKKVVAVKGSKSDCIGKEQNANTTVNVVFKNGDNTVEGDNKDVVFYDSGEGSQRQIRTKALNHTVTIADGIKASVTPDTEYALAGETVTLTLGTAVDASTLKVNNGDVSLTNTGDGKCTFTMPDGNVTVTATVAETYSVNLPANMEIVSATNAADTNGKYISGTVVSFKASFPYTASNVSDGTSTLTAMNGVYSVTVGTADITITATVQRNSTIDLSGATVNFTAENGDVLTGTTDKTVTIAEGASITLSGATINGGIVCTGTATITLTGTNSVTGAYSKAGIQIGSSGTMLTIKGDGSLTATGGEGGAGIGTSVVFSKASFTGGNITIKGGSITAIGTEFDPNTHDGGDGIGTGYIYANASGQIGTVTIYDDIDTVDASSITNFDSVVYMHGEENVTASKADYFTIVEEGDRRVITQKHYTITVAGSIEHGNVTADKSGAVEGDTVILTVTPGEGYSISSVKYNDTEITANNGVYSFTMPAVNVTISVTFTPIEYTITYDLDGGTVATANPTKYTIETATFTLPTPTREHYRFTGWTLDGSDDDPSETITIPQGTAGNLKYTANWEELPYFAYHSMILSGQIGVEFYAHSPNGWDGTKLSAVFTVGGNSYPEQIYDPELEAEIDGGHYYGFRCYISSVQMADEIQAVLKYDNEEVETETYTAKEYLDGLIADTSYPADTIALGRAVKNYGSYVQPVLAETNGWTINEDHKKMDSVDAYAESDFETVRTAVAGHEIFKDIDGTGVSEIKYTLCLNADTAIEVLLTPESGKSISNVKVNGKVNGAELDGKYRVEIAGISAHKLGNVYTITGSAGGSRDFTVKVSALSYVQGALNDDDGTVEMKRAVTSLYKYCDAAKTYRDNRPNEYK